MKKTLLLSICFYTLTFCQEIHKYDPQLLYSGAGSLYDIDSLRSLYIEFYDPDYHTILKDAWENDPKFRLPAKISLGDTTLDSVAIRYKGSSTFMKISSDIKKPFNIDINEYVTGQRLMGAKKVKLSNAWYDPSFVKEVIGNSIYQKYLPTYETNLMKVYVQGDYLGLYVNQEAVDGKFLNKHFNENDGVFFKCDPIDWDSGGAPNLTWEGPDSSEYYYTYDIKSDYGWADLLELLKLLDTNPGAIATMVNVDRVLWYFAINNILINKDTYNFGITHNYYIYKTMDSLFQIIPWDCSETFVGAFSEAPDNLKQFECDLYHPNKLNPDDHPLMIKIFDNPLYKKIYHAHVRTILNEALDTAVIRAQAKTLQDLAYNAADDDKEKDFTIEQFTRNVEEIVTKKTNTYRGSIMPTINYRKAYLLSHPEIDKTLPEIIAVTASDDESVIMAEVSEADNVELMATISKYNSRFQPFAMTDDGTGADETADDGIYSAVLPFQDSSEEVRFYIRTQNSDAVKLLPERAEYEFYTLNPITVIGEHLPQNSITFTLGKNYPNPVTSTTTIRYTLPVNSKVRLTVYNLVGKEVKTLVNNFKSSGIHNVAWDGRDNSGNNVGSGIYIYKLQSVDRVLMRKMTLVR